MNFEVNWRKWGGNKRESEGKENCLSLAVQSSVLDDQEFLPCISSRMMHFDLVLLKAPFDACIEGSLNNQHVL